MSTIALGRYELPDMFKPTRSAYGSDDRLRVALEGAKLEVQRAASSAQSLARAALARVLTECAVADWDGYGAHAVSTATALRAERFLDLLPSTLTPPDIVPDPDGSLSISWYFDKPLQLTISIAANGPLHFAGILGEDYGQSRVRHGSEPFESVLPGDLLRLIHELHERAGAGAGARRAA